MGAVRDRIVKEVLGWPEVSQASHRFGGVEFRFRGSELGHLHGDALVDLPFPKRIRDDLIAAGRAQPHHVLPESGWVSVWIRAGGRGGGRGTLSNAVRSAGRAARTGGAAHGTKE